MNRRLFLQITALGALTCAAERSFGATAPRLAVTMDDFKFEEEAVLSAKERSRRILEALGKHRAQTAAFVIARSAQTPTGDAILNDWARAGHTICNHSYSHLYYNSADVSFEDFAADFERADQILRPRRGFQPLFRFPFLKEGDTIAKRDAMRTRLHERGYRNGHVTIDTADWLIDERLRQYLQRTPGADLGPYRELYVRSMLTAARYHRELALAVFGGEVPHTLLTHFRLLNALFLGDVLAALRNDRWQIIAARDAYADPIFLREPNVLPAGDSLVWAVAKESGRKYDVQAPKELSEDWLRQEMDRLKL